MTSQSPDTGSETGSQIRPGLAGLLRRNALPLALAGAAFLLLALLFRTDREQELYKSLGNRYRFHAIPVALAQIYHHTPHDYTSFTCIAHRFQNTERDIQELIDEAIAQPLPENPTTYYWVADDRGLGDYVYVAFRLYGPRVKSLTKLFFLALGVSLGLFVVGYWRKPAALLLPVAVLFGILALAQVLKLRAEIPFSGTIWQEEIALYESRMFDMLALMACFHLALLAVAPRVPRAAWFTALPQAALLLLLYHARSSLGWQYLALFMVIGGRLAGWGWQRWRAAEKPGWSSVARPMIVAAALIASLVGLAQYKRATYNPAYFAERGTRTFWHNALMGFVYHPELRESFDTTSVSDYHTVVFILRQMRATNDPRLDPTWEPVNIMNSLGCHCRFDWNTYDQVAKEQYFRFWREHPRQAAECYAYYKPVEVEMLGAKMLQLLVREVGTYRARNLLPGLAVCLLALGIAFAAGRRSPEVRGGTRTAFRLGLVMILFAAIPGVAFYPAITTLSCFYVGLPAVAGLGLLRVGWWVNDRIARRFAPAPLPAVTHEPAPIPVRKAA